MQVSHFCGHCGQPLNPDGTCPVCNPVIIPGPYDGNDGGRNKPVLIAVIVCGILAAVSVGVTVLLLMTREKTAVLPSLTTVQAAADLGVSQEATLPAVQTTEAPTAPAVTAYYVTEQPTQVIVTVPVYVTVPVTSPPVTAPPVTSAPRPVQSFSSGSHVIVNSNTPAHAGLVVRGSPSSQEGSAKLGVIPEGEVLMALGETSGRYVKVRVYPTSSTRFYEGWVLGEYLSLTTREFETFAAPLYDVSGGDYSSYSPNDSISYTTPSHAGVVMRSEATSLSEKLGVLKEGAPVYAFGATDNGYVNVIAYPGTDQAYEGWILEMYLQSRQ